MKKLKKISLSILIGSTLSFTALANNSVENAIFNTSDNSDASYTIGYSIGKNMTEQLKQEDIFLNTIELQQGFIAGIEEKTPKISEERMEQAMQAFQQEMEAKIQASSETNGEI